MKIFLHNIGTCDLNYQDYFFEDILPEYAEITKSPNEADVVIFTGTCACTEVSMICAIGAMKEVLQNVKPSAKIYMTGCLSRSFTKTDKSIDKAIEWIRTNIHEVIPQNKPHLLLERLFDQNCIPDEYTKFGYFVPYVNDNAAIYISNGCLNKCSFCKTTFQHYPLQSMDINIAKEMIDFCDEEKTEELLLVGTNISQFGLDNYGEHKLPELIEYIEGKKNISRLKLIGLGFADAMHNDFADVMRNGKKLYEISGSLESGSDRLLKLIRKGFTVQEFIEFANYISELYVRYFNLNIIAGFPTESIDDVKKTLEALKMINTSQVAICRYIDSAFVDSHQYEQLSPDTIQEHTRVYSKVLHHRKVNHIIVGEDYVYNDRLEQFSR